VSFTCHWKCKYSLANSLNSNCNIFSLLVFPAQYLWLREFRLGINHFQPKVECGEARSGSVAAEGRWVVWSQKISAPSFLFGGKSANAQKIPILCYFYTVWQSRGVYGWLTDLSCINIQSIWYCERKLPLRITYCFHLRDANDGMCFLSLCLVLSSHQLFSVRHFVGPTFANALDPLVVL
jgi:hypothetical protein